MFRRTYPAHIAHRIETRWQRRFADSESNDRFRVECCGVCGGAITLLTFDGSVRPDIGRTCTCNDTTG